MNRSKKILRRFFRKFCRIRFKYYFAKGLTEKEIKDKFNNEKVIVSWTDKDKKQMKKQYNLGELLEWEAETNTEVNK